MFCPVTLLFSLECGIVWSTKGEMSMLVIEKVSGHMINGVFCVSERSKVFSKGLMALDKLVTMEQERELIDLLYKKMTCAKARNIIMELGKIAHAMEECEK